MKKITLLLLSCVCQLAVYAQQKSSEESAVMLPIEKMFKGMNLGDSAMVHSAFKAGSVTLVSMGRNKEGKQQYRSEELKGFLDAIGTPHKEAWNEVIWDAKILIDGDFAQVWAPYAFYVEKRFNHCGVDAWHLYKEADGWKIFHLADTRQTEGCNVPAAVKDKFK